MTRSQQSPDYLLPEHAPKMRYPHQEPTPLTAHDVTVYKVRDDSADTFWHVVVKNAKTGETVTRDYLAWSEDSPTGKLPHEAATDLLGIVLTS